MAYFAVQVAMLTKCGKVQEGWATVSDPLFLIVLYFSVSDPIAPSTPCQTNGEPHPNSRSPTPPGPTRHLHGHSQPTDLLRPKEPPPLAPLQEQSRLGEDPPIRRTPSLQNSSRPSLAKLKERLHGVNGLSAEEFAQHFHQSVLQSTHKSQHKPKGEEDSDALCCCVGWKWSILHHAELIYLNFKLWFHTS